MVSCGAPDLPFLDTIWWYAKQFLAVAVIFISLGAVYFGALLYSEIKKDKKNEQQKRKD